MMKITAFYILVMLLPFAGAPSAMAGGHGTVDCRIDAGPCVTTEGRVTVSLDIAPKPLQTMRELTFQVQAREQDRLIENASVYVGLSMPGMFMGKNVVVLAPRPDGVYEGKGVIVRCPSGKKTWKAAVSVKRGTRTTTANFIFEVQ